MQVGIAIVIMLAMTFVAGVLVGRRWASLRARQLYEQHVFPWPGEYRTSWRR